ncbi:hypothetical protein VT99_11992 [Candidatus Electrothrix marina]|uniref:Uncharacterized protein n=1 Tax=Candidatus Electrothrix marina TaxID=1859130 RepID=A0A444J148_9BACT|nr:hypothetical protein VT99_11992 [Candidatus Electrothrix marina]
MTIFNLIAGTASILGIIFVIVGYVIKLRRSFKQKREDAEKEFKQEIDRLNAAGGTVSARTDLGFFVLIKLASLRDDINRHRHYRNAFLISTVMNIALGEYVLYVVREHFFTLEGCFPVLEGNLPSLLKNVL